jgi:hypothetical protein
MIKEGEDIAAKVKIETEIYCADIVNMILPITDKDRNCMQKLATKIKNRDQLLRIMKIFSDDPYCSYKFEERPK